MTDIVRPSSLEAAATDLEETARTVQGHDRGPGSLHGIDLFGEEGLGDLRMVNREGAGEAAAGGGTRHFHEGAAEGEPDELPRLLGRV
jgi:hypothetical protein